MGSAIVIILGSSASGKTTLARRLAAELRLACLGKDEIKEALFDALGVGDGAWSRRLSDAAFAVLLRLAAHQAAAGVPLLVEGNWRAAHAAGWREVLSRTGERPLQIGCHAADAERRRRFTARPRHAGHRDAELAGELPQESTDGAAAAGAATDGAPSFLAVPGRRITYRSDGPDDYPRVRDAVRAVLAL